MTTRVTEGARRERHKTERSSRAAALAFASLRFTARRSRARAFPSLNLKKKRDCNAKHVLTFILYLCVCSCMYPGFHQSSSNANSQGQASGWTLNRGTSVMAPASAQLTLTPAQEKEDNKSQEQAAKAKRVLFESTGNEIYQRLFTRHEYIN